jgi:hypothetical protein
MFGLCPSADMLKNTAFRQLDLFPSSGERVGDTPLSPLDTAHLNY